MGAPPSTSIPWQLCLLVQTNSVSLSCHPSELCFRTLCYWSAETVSGPGTAQPPQLLRIQSGSRATKEEDTIDTQRNNTHTLLPDARSQCKKEKHEHAIKCFLQKPATVLQQGKLFSWSTEKDVCKCPWSLGQGCLIRPQEMKPSSAGREHSKTEVVTFYWEQSEFLYLHQK